jgi:branched-subunit amino acid ABC-type transport system permease component
MKASFLFIQFLNGLNFAMLLFLISSGLSLVFGVLGVLNFAHGSLYMLGAYGTYTFLQLFQKLSIGFWPAILMAVLSVGIIGGIIEIVFLRPVYRRPHAYQLLLTYGLILVLDDLVKIAWGTDYKVVPKPAALSGSIKIFGGAYPTYDLFIIFLGPIVALGLWLLIHRTKMGMLIRAASLDREMTDALGINVPALFTLVFMLGSCLGAMGGALSGPIRTVSPGMGINIIIDAFVVVIVGGLGNLQGALLGSLIIGQLESFGILIIPRFNIAFIFILTALILITRPQGLLRKARI